MCLCYEVGKAMRFKAHFSTSTTKRTTCASIRRTSLLISVDTSRDFVGSVTIMTIECLECISRGGVFSTSAPTKCSQINVRMRSDFFSRSNSFSSSPQIVSFYFHQKKIVKNMYFYMYFLRPIDCNQIQKYN